MDDDTQPSRASDASATRKRRSSILKSQRPARIPFSEIEFNVATPTDTGKSRRVSFSKRTGVAEFVTNEATNTWKNFYEEHNKSLESSGNDSEANVSRRPLGHIGKSIFDQQFQDVEAEDFIGSLNANGSINNVNFTQQLVSLECTTDGKLTAPKNKFELSAFADQHSKPFGNDFTLPNIGENTGRIDVNFSVMQQFDEKDDLDEIQRDIERGSNNMGCHDHFDRQNMSEYIEIDLNMTQVARNEEDMSITDTIHSPVQDISKSCSIDKKISLNNDWVADKENIAINPYAAPRESINFAINDELDQVLIFDGKRLTLQLDKPEKGNNCRQTLLSNSSAETNQRKTIGLNVNNDLPNIIDDLLVSRCENSSFSGVQDLKSTTNLEDDISMTLPVNRVDIVPRRKTILDNSGNISMTQALPTHIISETAVRVKEHTEKRRTIVFEEGTGNISVTQSLPVKIIMNNNKLPERRRTIVYEDNTGNISITQAVPSNIIVNENLETNEKRKTIVFDDDKGDISVTQALSSNVILEDKVPNKRKTIVFDDDAGNISITQALPANIVLPDKQLQEKRRTIIYEDDTGNISVTQALPSNVILAQNDEEIVERRRTVLYENDTGNISVTQAIPSNILLERIEFGDRTTINEPSNFPTTQSLPTNIILSDNEVNKRRTIVYDDNTGNISITQAIPSQLIPGYSSEIKVPDTSNAVDIVKGLNLSGTTKLHVQKRRTIIYDNDDDVSVTEAIPNNIILPDEATNKRKTIVFDNNDADISLTQAIPINVFLLDKLVSGVDQSIKMPESIEETNQNVIDYEACQPAASIQTINDVQERRNTVVLTADDCDAEMSMTEAIPKVQNLIQESEKRKTVIFDNDNGNISMTKPIPAELLAFQNEIINKFRNKQLDLTEQDPITNPSPDVIVYQAATTNSVSMMQSNRTDQGDSKSERPIPSNANSGDKVTTSSKVTDEVEGSVCTGEIESADVSLIHPRVEEKSEQLDLKPSTVAMDVDKKVADVTEIQKETAVTEDPPILEKPKDSVLNTLLDMSTDTIETGTEDKNILAQIESNHSFAQGSKEETDATSSESMFYITKDSDEDAQTKSVKSINMPTIVDRSPLPLEYKEEDGPKDDLQKKLAELRTAVTEDKNTSINRLYEKIVSSELEGVVERDENVELREQSITFRKANDTQELLDMISDFTDKKNDDENEPIVIKVKGRLASENKTEVTEPKRRSFAPNRQSIVLSREDLFNNISGHKALENKTEVAEPKRRSFAPNRQSIALSKEDLFNNISMAQAVLQKSRITLDDSECNEDDTRDESMDQILSKKSVRTSNEVVKTLHFDDESMSDTSIKSDTKMSPLKKTAFGETSYMTETKVKVIPTYLKDVSDGIKELMLDLVKPMTDTMPFESTGLDKAARKVPSTHSTQVQANLITSSQVEIDSELYSNPESGYDVDKMSSLTGGVLNKSRSRSFRSPAKFSNYSSEKSSEFEVPSPRQRYMYSTGPVEQSPSAKVLIFDHLNPLNNILLGSLDYSEAHKYNPKKSDETLCGSDRSRSGIHLDANTKDNEHEVENVTTNYRMESRFPHVMQGDVCPYQQDDDESLLSNSSKPISIDQSIDVKVMELKDNEANTLIVMKGNKELLEASSSLTLVDDGLVQQSEGEIESRTTSQDTQDDAMSDNHIVKTSQSPVKIMYKNEDQGTITETVAKKDFSSQDEDLSDTTKKSKGKKRIYSPSTNHSRPLQPLEVTPKPNVKMQKMSNSPNIYRGLLDLPVTEESTKMPAEKDVTNNIGLEQKGHQSKVHEKKKLPHKAREQKPGTSITVQQLITEYHVDAGINQNIVDRQILDALNPKSEPTSQSDVLESNSLEEVSSFTSSKNLNAMKDVHSRSTTQSQQSHLSSIPSQPSRVDWHPELISAVSSNLTDSESGVNVVAKIDMLPFMGSHECEWESSSADTWSFRLLHNRLRLTARLAHRHDNAARTRVRGDTPVLDVNVETVQHDKKNPVATLCVRFACETMRYMVSKTCRNACYASDIPPLLRRCAAVARVALRWGRAMHDAKLHLAYTLDNDGHLTLKVANIPLRSVWEVSMRVELVVDDPREAPWPRAGGVRVTRVVSDVSIAEHDVRRALAHTPRDWGHAPRTIWRMFRYLKHKTRDDDLLLA